MLPQNANMGSNHFFAKCKIVMQNAKKRFDPGLRGGVHISRVRVNDIEIAYRTFGSGYPLLKLVGFSATMDSENLEFVGALAKHFKVITLDNRGIGQTTAGLSHFSIEQFAEDAADFMDAIGLERAHVMGTSMGGFIAQELVLNHWSKVDRLILMSTSCGGLPSIPISEEVFNTMCDVSGTTEERLERIAGLMFECRWLEDRLDEARGKLERFGESASAESLYAQREAMEQWNGSCERLKSVESPTLTITGTEDLVIPTENSSIISSLIPDCRLVELEGGGHGLSYQFPDECASFILDFLKI